MKALYLLFAVLVIAGLVGVGGGIAYNNLAITLISVFAVILFMWLGFYVKSRQQAASRDDK
ncbi:hypothetical protein EWI07_02785 [Sporolactobacillus sp. THM7-4]|nr:hypothetical protein EWI07_02785 [Sporolactobacillus sp. THM7-4]